MALREARAALVYLRIVAIRHFADELMRTHSLCSGDDLLIRGVQATVADVIHDGAGENEAVLQHDAHLRAQRVQRYLGNVVPVDEHPAGIDVVETRDEVDDRRFAGTRGTDKRDGLARFHIEIEVLQNVDGAVVGECHVVERHVALDNADVFGVRRVADLDGRVHDLKEALHAAHAALELLRKLHDAVNGIDERCDIQKVRHKLRGVDGAVHHEDGARNDDHDIHEAVKEFIGGFKAAHIHVAQALNIVKALVALFKFLFFKRLVREGFHHAHAKQAVFPLRVDLAELLALAAELCLHSLIEEHGGRQHKRQHRKDNQRQRHTHRAQNHECADDLNARNEKFLRTVMRKLRDVKQVSRDAGHELTDLRVVKIRERELLQVCEHVAAHVGLDLCAHDVADRRHEERRAHVDEL